MDIAAKINSTDTLGTAVRYSSPRGRLWFLGSAGRKLYIEPRPLAYLKNLNGYDQLQVCKGIEALASVPSPQDGMVNVQRPAFFKAKVATATVFNFIIKYELGPGLAVVSAIALNQALLGPKPRPKDERASLYNVSKMGDTRFGAQSSLTDIAALPAAWRVNQAVAEVKTDHAAVNGMLNDLTKAVWLMGVHAEHAYPSDSIGDYTLFHNPSESGGLDFFESARDNLGLTTDNARHLAAVLADVQRKGKPVKWVVHSQGGIIFKQAVAYFAKRNKGASLDKNSVVFHAGGNNKKVTDRWLALTGVKKAAPDNDNPFDLVPNIAGGNNMSAAAISRSVQFWEKVKGNDTSSAAESPHTLPFITLEAYRRFLTLAGDQQSAARVQAHMDKLAAN